MDAFLRALSNLCEDPRICIIILILAIIGAFAILGAVFISIRKYLIGFLTVLSILLFPLFWVLFFEFVFEFGWINFASRILTGISSIAALLVSLVAGGNYIRIYREYVTSLNKPDAKFPHSRVFALLVSAFMTMVIFYFLVDKSFGVEPLRLITSPFK